MKDFLRTIHWGIICSQAHSPELRYATASREVNAHEADVRFRSIR